MMEIKWIKFLTNLCQTVKGEVTLFMKCENSSREIASMIMELKVLEVKVKKLLVVLLFFRD